jgi:hypothetical protein
LIDTEISELLAESAEALFSRHSSAEARRTIRPGELHQDLWDHATTSEFHLLGDPLDYWATVIRIAGRHAAAIPLMESTTAAWLLAEAGLEIPDGPLAILSQQPVPYGRHATGFVLVEGDEVRIATPEEVAIAPGLNVAGEPRDHVEPGGPVGDALALRLALGRALLISGALEGALAVTLAHVRDRVQFGVSLAKLPVVRDRLSLLAEEVAAARAVTDAAVAAPGLHTIASAKIRAGEAAGRGARVAHQLNGALGMTEEHELQHFTRRLWAWRDEDGDEREWAVRLGRALIADGGARLWPRLTA